MVDGDTDSSLIPLFNQGGSGADSEAVPAVELLLCVSTAKEMVASQEN